MWNIHVRENDKTQLTERTVNARRNKMTEIKEVPEVQAQAQVQETQPEVSESAEVRKLKRQLSEYASEISQHKKKAQALQNELNAHLTEEEKAEAERAKKWETMESELNALKHDKDVSAQKAEYIAMGFNPELAQETAEALVNGDFTTVNANLKLHYEGVKKQAVADAMMGTPKPIVSNEAKSVMTVEQIMAITDNAERKKAIAEHPELFGIE